MTFSIRILNTSVLAAVSFAAFAPSIRAAGYEMPKTKVEADTIKKSGQRKCLEYSSNMQSYAVEDGMSSEEKIVRGELKMEQERNKQLCDEQAELDSQVLKRLEEIDTQKSRAVRQENALKNTKQLCYTNSLPITEIETAAKLNGVTIAFSGLTTVAGGISIWQNVQQRKTINGMSVGNSTAPAAAKVEEVAVEETDAGGGTPVTPPASKKKVGEVCTSNDQCESSNCTGLPGNMMRCS
jgi:hypothetical protein